MFGASCIGTCRGKASWQADYYAAMRCLLPVISSLVMKLPARDRERRLCTLLAACYLCINTSWWKPSYCLHIPKWLTAPNNGVENLVSSMEISFERMQILATPRIFHSSYHDDVKASVESRTNKNMDLQFSSAVHQTFSHMHSTLIFPQTSSCCCLVWQTMEMCLLQFWRTSSHNVIMTIKLVLCEIFISIYAEEETVLLFFALSLLIWIFFPH